MHNHSAHLTMRFVVLKHSYTGGQPAASMLRVTTWIYTPPERWDANGECEGKAPLGAGSPHS